VTPTTGAVVVLELGTVALVLALATAWWWWHRRR